MSKKRGKERVREGKCITCGESITVFYRNGRAYRTRCACQNEGMGGRNRQNYPGIDAIT